MAGAVTVEFDATDRQPQRYGDVASLVDGRRIVAHGAGGHDCAI
jgi:hypothetical protein